MVFQTVYSKDRDFGDLYKENHYKMLMQLSTINNLNNIFLKTTQLVSRYFCVIANSHLYMHDVSYDKIMKLLNNINTHMPHVFYLKKTKQKKKLQTIQPCYCQPKK